MSATDVGGNKANAGFEINLLNLNLTSIENPDLVSIPWNTPLESLSLPESVKVQLNSGNDVQLPVQLFDSRVAGLYQYSGRLELGNVQNPDQLQVMLSILIEDKALPEAIAFSGQEFSANIDPSTPIGTFETLDQQDNIHRYTLTASSEDNRYFALSGNTLYWDSQEALPGKVSFTVKVSSTDRAGNTIFETFTLNRLRMAMGEIFVPNTFTPNGDGINDSWAVKSAYSINLLHDTYGAFKETTFLASYASGVRVSASHQLRLGAGLNYQTIRLDGNALTSEQAGDPLIGQYLGGFSDMQIFDFNLGLALTHKSYYFYYAMHNVNKGRISGGEDFMDGKPVVYLIQGGFRETLSPQISLI
ncbi:MAG: type IX secretion system membrane protein PorP/SprF, partial [Cyclobacterium sp.]|uniref:type IX secretion system membrane protein PorP/SprF n=1 Tax=Cyclobacterium sp. TaxID=1966343 RepID=UPI003970B8B7